MRTIPVENAQGQLIVRHPRPRVDRDPDTGKVKFNENNQPIYFQPAGQQHDNLAYPIYVKKLFVVEHVVGSAPLARGPLVMFLYLTTQLRYCTPFIVHGPDGEPIPYGSSNEYVQAFLPTYGNRVPARSIEQMMAGTGFKSPETVERAIRELRSRGVVDDYAPHERTVQRERRGRGRPIKKYRLEIHPDYAWAGPMPSSVGYAQHVHSNEPYRFVPTDPNWRMPRVKG